MLDEKTKRDDLFREATKQAGALRRGLQGDLGLAYLGEVNRETALEFERALSLLVVEAKKYQANFGAFLPEEKGKPDPDMEKFGELHLKFIELRAKGGLSPLEAANQLGLSEVAGRKWNELLQKDITEAIKRGGDINFKL